MTAPLFLSLAATSPPPPRVLTGLPPLDRALGGGFVLGEVVLVAGDPGAGKSTLLLQVAAALGTAARPSVYLTAEEAAPQVQERAARLGLAGAAVRLAATSDVTASLAALAAAPPAFLVVDSVQA